MSSVIKNKGIVLVPAAGDVVNLPTFPADVAPLFQQFDLSIMGNDFMTGSRSYLNKRPVMFTFNGTFESLQSILSLLALAGHEWTLIAAQSREPVIQSQKIIQGENVTIKIADVYIPVPNDFYHYLADIKDEQGNVTRPDVNSWTLPDYSGQTPWVIAEAEQQT